MSNLITTNKLAAANIAAKSPQKSGTTEMPGGLSFGAVLAQQVVDNIPAAIDTTPTRLVPAKDVLADKNLVSGKSQDEKNSTLQNIPAYISGNIVALPQPLQEIPAQPTKDSFADKVAATTTAPDDKYPAPLNIYPDQSNNVNALPQPLQGNPMQSTKDSLADKAAATTNTPDDKYPAPLNIHPDQSSNMPALLQPAQEIRSQIAQDTSADKATTASTVSDGKHSVQLNMPADSSGNMLGLPLTLPTNPVSLRTEIPGDSNKARQGITKSIATDSSPKLADTSVASETAGTSKSATATPAGFQVDPKHLPSEIVKPLETSIRSNLFSQATATQNIATLGTLHLQNSTLHAASDISPPLQQSITTPLGNNGWANEFSQKINWMTTNQHEQIAELHLNPPDLGPLNVVLKISDNQATALFTSPHSAVRETVENAMPKLREILADNGITLGNTTVSDQPQRDNNAAAFSGQQSQQNRPWATPSTTQTDLAARPTELNSPVRKHNGMVDTFA